MSSAPQVMSTTVGVSLPGFAITKDLAEKKTITIGKPQVALPVKKQNSKGNTALHKLWIALPLVLLVLNISMLGWYLYSVNTLEGMSYTLAQTRKEVGKLQDVQRQYQVSVAEQAANVRLREVTAEHKQFVAVGTPEFISSSSNIVTMR